MKLETQNSWAYDEGASCKCNGGNVIDNPYRISDERYYWWLKGFQEECYYDNFDIYDFFNKGKTK